MKETPVSERLPALTKMLPPIPPPPPLPELFPPLAFAFWIVRLLML